MFEMFMNRNRATTEAMDNSIHWQDLVQAYSARQLTQVQDKPLAIHAVKEWLMEYETSLYGYALGIFRSKAPIHLSWNVKLDAPPMMGRIPGIPTWSWMSVDGPVEYDSFYGAEHHREFQITSWPSADPFGRVLDPAISPLKIRGLIKEVLIPHRLWKDGVASEQQIDCFDILQLSESPEREEANRVGYIMFDQYRALTPKTEFNGTNKGTPVSVTPDEHLNLTPPSRYKHLECLVVLEKKYHRSLLYGLVVAPAEQVSATSKDMYQRIGYFYEVINSERLDELLNSYFDDGTIAEISLI